MTERCSNLLLKTHDFDLRSQVISVRRAIDPRNKYANAHYELDKAASTFAYTAALAGGAGYSAMAKIPAPEELSSAEAALVATQLTKGCRYVVYQQPDAPRPLLGAK